jgi:hypothetical protein
VPSDGTDHILIARQTSTKKVRVVYCTTGLINTTQLSTILRFKNVAEKFSEKDISEFRKAFTLEDKDEDGKISVEESGLVMRLLGQNLTEAELSESVMSTIRIILE